MADTNDEAVHREAVQLQIQADILKKIVTLSPMPSLKRLRNFCWALRRSQKLRKEG